MTYTLHNGKTKYSRIPVVSDTLYTVKMSRTKLKNINFISDNKGNYFIEINHARTNVSHPINQNLLYCHFYYTIVANFLQLRCLVKKILDSWKNRIFYM